MPYTAELQQKSDVKRYPQANKQITFYTTITRDIIFPIEPRGRLEKVDEKSGKSKEQELLEFCKTPKLGREIYRWLGLKASHYATHTFIMPLVKSGKLIMTLPNFPTSNNQRYVTAGFEPPVASDENIIEYCKKPRRKKEIEEHFSLSNFQLRQHLEPLIIAGKIKGTDPKNPKNHWQRYTSTNTDAP